MRIGIDRGVIGWAVFGGSLLHGLGGQLSNVETRPSPQALQSIYNLDTNITNVVFLIGHVTIPYSGNDYLVDGHDNHQGAWPADSWYGAMTGTWTDTSRFENPPNVINYNAAGDGRWDQDVLPSETGGAPGRLEMGVGRIDFRFMQPFQDIPGGEVINDNRDDTQVRLLKLYFDKVKRWRRGQISAQDDFQAWMADGNFYGLAPTVQRLSTHLWGSGVSDPNQCLNDTFLATTNHLWGVHGDYGHFGVIGNVPTTLEPRRHTAAQIAQELSNDNPRAMFQLHHGSYLGEWFHWDNDALRAVLGVTNSSLTSTWLDIRSGAVWRTDRFHLGAPYAAALQDTFAAHATLSCRTTAILGDPFLREHPLAPVSSLSLTANSANIVLSWPTQSAATAGYRIFRASSTNSATWTTLTDVGNGATGWTNVSPGSGTYAYLIKSLSLKTTGSGSYTNTSLGTFSSTEVTLP